MSSAHCKLIGIGILCMVASLAHAGILEHWPLEAGASDLGGRLTPRLYVLERSIRVDVASEASSLASRVQFGFALSGPITQLPTPLGGQPFHVHVQVLELDAPGPLPPSWGYGSSRIDPDLPGHSVAGWTFGETPPVIDHAIASPRATVRLLVTLSAIHVRSDGEFTLSIEPNTGQATVIASQTPEYSLANSGSRAIAVTTMPDCALVAYKLVSTGHQSGCDLSAMEVTVDFVPGVQRFELHYLREFGIGPLDPGSPIQTYAERREGATLAERESQWMSIGDLSIGGRSRHSDSFDPPEQANRLRLRYRDLVRLNGLVVLVVADQGSAAIESVDADSLGTFACHEPRGCSFGHWAGTILDSTAMLLLAASCMFVLTVAGKRARRKSYKA